MLTLLVTLWVVVTITVQAKDGLCWDQFPMNMFLLLTVKFFGCLHQKANEFFPRCANMVWGMKATRSPTLLVLRTFYRHRVSLAL